MSNTDDFNRISHLLLETEIRLKAINSQIDAIEREIAILNMHETQLMENIRLLKRRKLVTVAIEYKKSVEALEKVRNRRAVIRVDLQNVVKNQKHAQSVYNKTKEDHDNKLEALKEPKNNVIYVNFGRKDGQR